MLKNVDLTKSGEYDGFYEGSITVQETPIINVYQKDQISSVERKGKSLLEKTMGIGVKNAFDKTTGVVKNAFDKTTGVVKKGLEGVLNAF